MGVSSKNIGDDDSVFAAAVDIKGQSVNRHYYNSDPRAVISVQRGDVAAASITPGDLPGPLEGPTGVIYFFHADDLPMDDNPAHAEIRPHRPAVGFNPNHDPSKKTKTWLREILARKFRIVIDDRRRPP